jgi:hypothetical protein
MILLIVAVFGVAAYIFKKGESEAADDPFTGKRMESRGQSTF